MASSSTSPCAACKFLRRKCQPECVFAPYFPPDQPQKFANVHKVFGAANVTKLLNELHPSQREDAVNSLAYEADMRLRDPVYGCVGVISLLQHQLRQLQMDLSCAKSELSKYQSLAGSIPTLHGGIYHRDHHHYFPAQHHQFFPRDLAPPQMIRVDGQSGNPNGNNSSSLIEGGLLAMNNVTASIGQLSQFQQSARAARGDDRRAELDPS
uniref:LOB domain-containing protein n=1 Tax=Kalanchoe fedtschenkoi TaxID=63787 RepID=A0A7N0U6F0_KALFE